MGLEPSARRDKRDNLKTAQRNNLKMVNPENSRETPIVNAATSVEALEQPQEFDQALEATLNEWSSTADDAAFEDLA